MKEKDSISNSKALGAKEQPLTKRLQKKLDKKLAQYLAFSERYSVGVYIRPIFVKQLIKGMITDHEKHPVFLVHHKINFGGCGIIHRQAKKFKDL